MLEEVWSGEEREGFAASELGFKGLGEETKVRIWGVREGWAVCRLGRRGNSNGET